MALGQFAPGGWTRRNRRLHSAVPHLSVIQDQETIMHIRNSGGVGNIPNVEFLAALGHDPQAFRAVLQDHGRAGLIVGDGALHAHPLGAVDARGSPLRIWSIGVTGRDHGLFWARFSTLMFSSEVMCSMTPVCCILPSNRPRRPR